MNLMLFGFILTVMAFHSVYSIDGTVQFIDILPDFIGYLLIWYTLEKRRINKRMRGLYTASAVMAALSFLYFLGQIKFLFAEFLTDNLVFIGWILDGITYVLANYNDLLLLTAVGMLGWFLFAMLGHWEQTDRHKLQCGICKAGLGACGIAALGHIGATFIILPFSWHWICYPASLLGIAAAWFVTKDCEEMISGSSVPAEERRYGPKKKQKEEF